MQNTEFEKHVKEMKDIAEVLIPYTFPLVHFKEEHEILPLKCRNAVIDGYDVSLNFSKSINNNGLSIESLQIQSIYGAFLPFYLVCKIGKAFLGDKCLAYIDFLKKGKKIYCWTVKKHDGNLVINEQSTASSFEGLDYNILQKGTVSLFEN